MERLLIYDFDSTLFDTPLPEEGRVVYKERTGFDFPAKGWWGRPESLDTSVFDIQPIKSVYETYLEINPDRDYKVLLTGRHTGMSDTVMSVIEGFDVSFDEYHFKTSGDTLSFKLSVIDGLVERVKPRYVEIFEDRLEHHQAFSEYLGVMVSNNRIAGYKAHLVIK